MDSDDENYWEEPVEGDQKVTCPFCNSSFRSIGALWEHCKETHQFDINYAKLKFSKFLLFQYVLYVLERSRLAFCVHNHFHFAGLDFYGYIRMVNFIRAEVIFK